MPHVKGFLVPLDAHEARAPMRRDAAEITNPDKETMAKCGSQERGEAWTVLIEANRSLSSAVIR